jgi:hypothetical protein
LLVREVVFDPGPIGKGVVMTAPPEQRLKKLLELFDNDCVVVPIPRGEKGPIIKEWQKVTFERAQQPDWQRRLCACFKCGGNLGILLGPASGDLVDIDIDLDDRVEPFLEANPKLRNTLRRRGKRGCGLMVRMADDYPVGRWDLQLADGTKFGEWRAGGGHQSVVFGRHPEKDDDGNAIDYKILVAQHPTVLTFEDIVWPDWVKRPLPWEKQPAPAPQSTNGANGQHDADLDKRIRAYMATMPAAVSGQHGHDATYKVACILTHGFGLSTDEARPYLHAYNALCQPPWTEKELEHKLADAIKEPLTRPYGFLRNKEAPKTRKSETQKTECTPEGFEGNEGFAPIYWPENPSNPSNPSPLLTQKTSFPTESILGDYYAYAVTQSKGADCYIIGAILPVVAALLRRNVWLPWANGALYPNLYSLMVGPPGNMKSTSIDLPEIIARGIFGCEQVPYFLPHNYSPESLFDAYFQHPHRLLICDDANVTLNKWQNPTDGDRLSSHFLALFDGKRLSENFRRNREKRDLDSQERVTEPTSTNIVFGVTFNACEFRGNAQRAGLQRRFLCYVAEDTVRKLKRPQPDGKMVNGLIKQFSFLIHLRGEFNWTPESERMFDDYADATDERIRACSILDDRARARLTTAGAWVAKIAMIFEACQLCYIANWMPDDPQIVPTSPPLVIRPEILVLAIEHVESCLSAAAGLDQIANRQSIIEQAQLLLAYIHSRFGKAARDGSIILTRSQITDTYAHNIGRRSGSSITDIYERWIPCLIELGEAKLLVKEGKKEIYAFRAET